VGAISAIWPRPSGSHTVLIAGRPERGAAWMVSSRRANRPRPFGQMLCQRGPVVDNRTAASDH
jgi:hypothetical protein